MTNYDEIDFSPLTALTDGEVITHARVRDIRLASGKVLTTLAQNYDDGKVRPASAYRPIWLETDGQQATVVEMYR